MSLNIDTETDGIIGTLEFIVIYNEAANIGVQLVVDIVTKNVEFYLHNGTNKTKYDDIETAAKNFYSEVHTAESQLNKLQVK